jgi:hypothetical protein
MSSTIEQNVPVPRAKGGAKRYPFSQLKIGDSVLQPYETLEDAQRALKAAYRLANYHGWNIISRKLPEGIRIWRVEGKHLENKC